MFPAPHEISRQASEWNIGLVHNDQEQAKSGDCKSRHKQYPAEIHLSMMLWITPPLNAMVRALHCAEKPTFL